MLSAAAMAAVAAAAARRIRTAALAALAGLLAGGAVVALPVGPVPVLVASVALGAGASVAFGRYKSLIVKTTRLWEFLTASVILVYSSLRFIRWYLSYRAKKKANKL